ncbi:SPO22 domain-containing protein [Rhizoctonia solani AG-1 IA]|uniref:SPO22 domain-containing protein n=1 Tax=Thanatephorus cucumeris (strain AG1-IA) TaxID=983506 RepID=L8X2P3_THACA|nr:SPO22 domain-containing protein [Rhizoctonia solani AG-1 IA]
MTNSGEPSGVRLWNASILLRGVQDQVEAESRKRAFASPAFRLIEAGSDVPPTVECQWIYRRHVDYFLTLASKTATALSECNDDRARSIMISAYESQLKNLKTDDRDISKKEYATAQYYCGRMDAVGAWKDGNESVGFFMFEQATDERRLSTMSIPEIEEILGRALEIGKAALSRSWDKETDTDVTTPAAQSISSTADVKAATIGVKWFQKILQVLERVKHNERSSLPSLRVSLRNSPTQPCLARAYFASSGAVESNLERAEATIEELIQGKDTTKLDINLLWMKLAVLKRRGADSVQISNVFSLILDKLEFQEGNVMSFLREAQTMVSLSVNLAIVTMQELLDKALSSPDGNGYSFVGTITMALLLLTKSLQHSDAHGAAEKACQDIARRVDFVMEKTSAAMLWRNGEASYKAKKWMEAADWFTLSASAAFQSMASAQSRSIRKAALCYIQQGEYNQASILVSRWASNPLTLSSVRARRGRCVQNLCGEDRHTEISIAIQTVETMLSTLDFDRKMLLLAIQLAHETKQKALLLAVLEAMYKTMQREPHVDAETEGITLVRCSIRIILDLLKEPLAAMTQLTDSLKTNFQRALDLVKLMASKNNLVLIAKDLSWLWRTAYNAAVTGCQDWEELVVAEILDVSREVRAGIYCASILQCISFISIVDGCVFDYFGRLTGLRADCTEVRNTTDLSIIQVFVARRLGSTSQALYTRLARDISAFRERVNESLADGTFDGNDKLDYMINIFFTFEIEALCRIQEWQRIRAVVEVSATPSRAFFAKAMADLLVRLTFIPTSGILFTSLLDSGRKMHVQLMVEYSLELESQTGGY